MSGRRGVGVRERLFLFMGRAGLEGQPGVKEADSAPSLDWPHPFRSLEACLTPRACCESCLGILEMKLLMLPGLLN